MDVALFEHLASDPRMCENYMRHLITLCTFYTHFARYMGFMLFRDGNMRFEKKHNYAQNPEIMRILMRAKRAKA